MVDEWISKYNPFNSDKLLSQVYKWREIGKDKKIPAPTLVSIDPANNCDLKCGFCNAHKVLEQNNRQLSKETLEEVVDFLKGWGVEAVCIGGGGESLLNKNTSYLIDICVDDEIKNSGCIDKCSKNIIQTGVVTNGTQIHKNLESLSKCTWVGVSVDAGTKETYTKIKGKDKFDDVISNIKMLVEYSKGVDGRLTKDGDGLGVGLKYLIYKKNIDEIYQASKIAKDIGCSNIHIRPSAPPWDQLKNKEYSFSENDLESFRKGLEKARTLEDEHFKVYGITHKFDGKFNVDNNFKNCYAIFMTCVIMPPTGDGKFNLGFCCDRRGDKNLTLENLTDVEQIKEFWGSKEHWKMFDKIKPSTCPRCTYKPHNQIYENVIKVNSMAYQFI